MGHDIGSTAGHVRRPSVPAGAGPASLLIISALLLAVAPIALDPSYSVEEHTTSESAGQLVSWSWIARTGLVTFGFAVLWVSAARPGARLWGVGGTFAHRVFGASMVLTAVFSARPWDPAAAYSATEDLLHSIASFGVGLGFIVGLLLVGAHRGRLTRRVRWGDVAALAMVVALLLSMSVWSDMAGLFQRAMFAVAYLWYVTESLGSGLTFATSRVD